MTHHTPGLISGVDHLWQWQDARYASGDIAPIFTITIHVVQLAYEVQFEVAIADRHGPDLDDHYKYY
jgi:hypothetical protein